MREKEIDKLLYQAKEDLDVSFYPEQLEEFEEKMWRYIKAKECHQQKEEKRIKKFSDNLLNLQNLVVLTVFFMGCLVIGVFAYFIPSYNEKQGKPIYQESVETSNIDQQYYANYYKMDTKNKGQSLLSVLVSENASGTLKIIYSNVMENVGLPEPIVQINMPMDQGEILLLSSKSDEKSYMHYRIVYLNEDKATPMFEQNYVKNGSIAVTDGLFIEEISGTNQVNRKSYILPIIHTQDAFFATTDKITIEKGNELILLVNPESSPDIKLKNNEETLLQESIMSTSKRSPYIQYTAKEVGDIILFIQDIDSNKVQEVYVHIVE